MKLNKKGFTLIELLAVIVILGVIMLIAIPSVSSIIANSRKNTFRSTAQTLISGARNMVLASTDGRPSAGDGWAEVVNATTVSNISLSAGDFVIKIGDIEVESGSGTKSPFGVDYNQEYSFVVAKATESGNYDYYIQMVDDDQNNLPLTEEDELDSTSVNTDSDNYKPSDFTTFTTLTKAPSTENNE